MKKSTAALLLLAIFSLTLLSRTLISIKTDKFSYQSYFALRQIENVNNFGFPLFEDSLSYAGRTHLFPPLFYYLLAFFSFLGTDLAAKLIPNILSSLIVVFVYLISFYITRVRIISLVSSFFSGFIPVFFITLNDLSIYSLVSVLMLAIIYCVMRIDVKRYLKLCLVLIVVLVFTHASAFVLIIGLLIFLLLLKIDSLEVENKEIELILFSSFLVLWFNFIIYKKALLIHGSYVIWQNIPLQILTNYFFDLNIIQAIYQIGILPVVLGVYAIYHVLFKVKRRSVLMILGVFLAVLILSWFKLIEFKLGLIFLSLMLVLLSSHSIKIIYSYLKKTKSLRLKYWFLLVLVILFVLTSLIPSINLAFFSLKEVPSDSEIDALDWLKVNANNESVVLARLEEGYLINYYTNLKTVIDSDFLLIEDAQQRYEDVQSVFSLRLKTEAVRRLNKYDVRYLYFSGKFGVENNLYYADPDCFELVYNNSVLIYEVKCTIQ